MVPYTHKVLLADIRSAHEHHRPHLPHQPGPRAPRLRNLSRLPDPRRDANAVRHRVPTGHAPRDAENPYGSSVPQASVAMINAIGGISTV